MVNIKLQTLTDNFEIKIDEQDRFFVNGVQQDINVRTFMFHLKYIIEGWEPEYVNNKITDGLSYSVVINKGQDKFSSKGINKFPKNFSSFLRLIREVKRSEKTINNNR